MPDNATATLKVDDPAPDFELTSIDGTKFHLGSYRGKSNVVVFFYPKDNTPGCTSQNCLFRDWHLEFTKYDAVLIGISSDSAESHADFAKKHDLPFLLLTDEGGTIRKRYGIRNDFGIIPGRATFVIDKEQIVRNIYVSQFNINEHIDSALKTLQQIKGAN